MPQRRALAGVAPGQQQRAGRALAKPCGEQCRTAHLGGDQRLDLVCLEDEQIRPGWGVVGVGQAHDDAVIAGGRLLVDPVALHQPPADRQRERPVHPQPVGRVQHQPPVAEFIAEAFHHERGVTGDRAGRGALVLQQPSQVLRRVLVETDVRTPLCERLAVESGQLGGERADRSAQFGGPAGVVAAPERQPRGLARRRDHQHAVMGDLGDAPTGGPECDHVTGPRFVDHLLVEFPDAGGLFVIPGQVHREQAAVGDGAPGRHGQPLRAGPRGQRARVAVVDQARSQLAELGGRVLPAEQVQGGFVGAAGQGGEGRAATHGVEPDVGVEGLDRARRHGVLGQNVERIGRHLHGFDLPADHALRADRASDQIGAVFGQQHAAGDLADLVPGASHPLQPAGHRRRRLHLDHQVDRAHVDTQLQT